jgi:hypothetical protein
MVFIIMFNTNVDVPSDQTNSGILKLYLINFRLIVFTFTDITTTVIHKIKRFTDFSH